MQCGGGLCGRGSRGIERAAVVRGVRRNLDHRVPGSKRKRRELDGAYSVQDRQMPAVASRATMVVGAAVMMRMNFHCTCRLNGGKVHHNEQNQQGPAQLTSGLPRNTP